MTTEFDDLSVTIYLSYQQAIWLEMVLLMQEITDDQPILTATRNAIVAAENERREQESRIRAS